MTDKPKILVVDDDPSWVQAIDSLLSDTAYDVETVGSFDLARDRLLTTGYAVIIIDLDLGDGGIPQTFEGLGLLSGLQFLEEIAQRHCKAIVLSAYGTTENIRQAFKRGAHDFIEKQHFDENEFLKTVREALEQWRLSRAVTTPRRELTPEEKAEYARVTRQFLQGKPIQLYVPDAAVNPWGKQS